MGVTSGIILLVDDNFGFAKRKQLNLF